MAGSDQYRVGLREKEMNENETEKRKTAWSPLLFGVLMAGIGAMMIIQGIAAYKSGATTPATSKIPSMTGLQSIITGVVAAVGGSSFVGHGIIKTFKSVKHFFVVGKHKVVVKAKNKSWGVLNSLDLDLRDGQLLTFYCTNEKVGAMLLNDFVIDQKAELEIKSCDGQQCELIGKKAYAQGRISLKGK